MYKSIEECDRRLAQLEYELEALKLDKKQVVEIRKFLEAHPAPGIPLESKYISSKAKRPSLGPKLLKIIEENPGIDGSKLRASFVGKFTENQLTSALSNLRIQGKIENRGGAGYTSCWYIKENDSD